MRGLVERLRGRGPDASSGSTSAAAWACPISTSPTRRRPADYAAMVAEAVGGLDVQLAFEPGRVIAANAGVLLARVIHVQRSGRRAAGSWCWTRR